MYTFEELSGNKATTSFAYWLLVERRTSPLELLAPEVIGPVMSYHFDIEHAAENSRILRHSPQLRYLQPVAPVTLAYKWAPFKLAEDILGTAVHISREPDIYYPTAVAVWRPRYLGEYIPADRSEHPCHFTFLLRLACSLALENKGRVVLVGKPGWSYTSWRDRVVMMNPDTSLVLHSAGYLYTDRVSQ